MTGFGCRWDRPTILVLASLAAALVLLPIGLDQPGMPLDISPDQRTHFAAAVSLAVDGDLRCGPEDLDRLFQIFPYAGGADLVMRPVADGGPPAFASDPLFTLLATPVAGWLGFDGVLSMVAAFFVAAIALVVGFGPGGSADDRAGPGVGFTLAFFFVSASFIYALRIHPATLNAWLVTVACAAAFARGGPSWWTQVSGLSLGLATVPVPVLLPLAPALWLRAERRGPWAVGFVTGVAVALGLAALLGAAPFADGAATTYFFESPYDHAALDRPAPEVEAPGDPVVASPIVPLRALGLALLERRTGLLPYFPFAGVLLLAAVASRRREDWPWIVGLLGSIVAIAWSPPIGADDPGGTSFADPRWVALYPAFVFVLVGAARSRTRVAATLGATVLGVLCLGPALVSMLGPAMAWGSPQGHTRGALARLPLAIEHIGRGGELAAFQVAGEGGPRLWLPRHATEVHGDEIWLLGGQRVELFFDAPPDQGSAWVTQWRSFAAGNRVQIRFGDDSRDLDFGGQPPGDPQGVDGSTRRTLDGGPGRRVVADGVQRLLWPMRVETSTGIRPTWLGGRGNYRVGAGLTVLGTPADLDRDVFGVDWRSCSAPETVTSGDELLALARMVNTSPSIWSVSGPARVRLGHRWFDADGVSVGGGPRVDFTAPVAPGEEVAAWVRATAPAEPGRYVLEIGPIFERVDWFADRDVEPCRVEVDVAPQSSSGEGSSGTR